MVESIGVDLVEIDRIEQVAERYGQRFLERVFTNREVRYCFERGERYASLAVRFAAKEALFKALGLGWAAGLRWRDVEIVSDASKKPRFVLHGKAKQMVGDRQVLVSLSHTSDQAVAVVALQSRRPRSTDARRRRPHGA